MVLRTKHKSEHRMAKWGTRFTAEEHMHRKHKAFTAYNKTQTCKIITKSASWVAFAEPKIELVVSLCPSSSFRGCITSVICTFCSVANFLNLSSATSCGSITSMHEHQGKAEKHICGAMRWPSPDRTYNGHKWEPDFAEVHFFETALLPQPTSYAACRS